MQTVVKHIFFQTFFENFRRERRRDAEKERLINFRKAHHLSINLQRTSYAIGQVLAFFTVNL